MNPRPTSQEIEAARARRRGWTRTTLAQWGVPWPPPKGWKKRLERGESFVDVYFVGEGQEMDAELDDRVGRDA